MGGKSFFIREGGGFDELMRCDSIRAPDTFSFFIERSMPSGHVLISFAGMACAKGGVKNVIYGRKE